MRQTAEIGPAGCKDSPAVLYLRDALWPHELRFVGSDIRRLIGRGPEEFVDQPALWMCGVLSEDLSVVFGALAGLDATGSCRTRYRIRAASGELRWIEDEMHLLQPAGAAGMILGFWSKSPDGGPPAVWAGEADAAACPDPRQAGRLCLLATFMARQLADFLRDRARGPRSVDLGVLVDELLLMLRPLVGLGIEVVRTGSPLVGDVEAAGTRIEQILLYLILKAREAVPGGRVSVHLERTVSMEAASTGELLRPGPRAVVTVTETRGDVEPDRIDGLLDPGSSAAPARRGSRLSDHPLRAMVKEVGGRVETHGRPGAWVRFRVTLPVRSY